jgi:hypothetical protein
MRSLSRLTSHELGERYSLVFPPCLGLPITTAPKMIIVRPQSPLASEPFLLIAAVLLSLTATGCAGGGGVTDDLRIRFAHTWLDRPIGDAIDQMGEPRTVPEDQDFTWLRILDPQTPPCRGVLSTWPGGVITTTRIEGPCPRIPVLEALGWIDPLTTDGLGVTYDRFHQVFRVSTPPRLLAPIHGEEPVEVWFVGGFHRDRPDQIFRGFILRRLGAFIEDDPGDVLRIPLTEELRAEARLLVDDRDAFPMPAAQELPLRGLAGAEDFLFLSVGSQSAQRLSWARTVEFRLPSGAEFGFDSDDVRVLRQALLVLFEPDKIRAAAGVP